MILNPLLSAIFSHDILEPGMPSTQQGKHSARKPPKLIIVQICKKKPAMQHVIDWLLNTVRAKIMKNVFQD